VTAKQPPKTKTARMLLQNGAVFALKTRLEQLIRRAKKYGVLVVADSDAVVIRLIPADEAKGAVDLRRLGTTVRVHDACGGRIELGRRTPDYARLVERRILHAQSEPQGPT
jgi:antitoxin (DNA-binding transcriptional repressor) of toxin-antitoxin stability system